MELQTWFFLTSFWMLFSSKTLRAPQLYCNLTFSVERKNIAHIWDCLKLFFSIILDISYQKMPAGAPKMNILILFWRLLSSRICIVPYLCCILAVCFNTSQTKLLLSLFLQFFQFLRRSQKNPYQKPFFFFGYFVEKHVFNHFPDFCLFYNFGDLLAA